jgi:hypothetical protein
MRDGGSWRWARNSPNEEFGGRGHCVIGLVGRSVETVEMFRCDKSEV